MKAKRNITSCFILSLLLICSCTGNKHGGKGNHLSKDLTQLKDSGVITAVTLYGSITYFQYRMQPMGYEYDLISNFAESQQMKLEMKIAKNIEQLFEMLDNGEADVIAYPIQVTSIEDHDVLFCGHENQSTQVLIQRADKGDTPLTDVTQLIGKEVYVRPQTRFFERLINLNEELGDGIIIKEVAEDSIGVEDLIGMVSRGEIPYTVADDYTARLNKTYYWNINISLPISFRQRTSWAVRESSPELAAAINKWAEDTEGKHAYKATTKRYFELSKNPIEGDLPALKDGHISPYDVIFRKYATSLGWDWQLLASISYQESHFNPNVVSWVGAEGLMGIMPNTAKALGVTPHELKDPDIGVRTGVECLRRFRQGFSDITNPNEKAKFVLASYNAGIGHVYDAQRLAAKYGKNANLWEDVSVYIRLKSDPEYYNDPVCKHGYLRGSETANYVEEVIRRYLYYKSKT